MKYRLHITLLFLILLSQAVMAQKVTIKGRVTDLNHKPIEIANVSIVGKPAGTVCDLNGNYTLTCESSDSLVVAYSMIGYQTRKRTFKNPTDTIVVNVTLPPMDIQLSDAVVTHKERQMTTTQQIEIPEKLRLNPSASGNGIEDIIKSQAGVRLKI